MACVRLKLGSAARRYENYAVRSSRQSLWLKTYPAGAGRCRGLAGGGLCLASRAWAGSVQRSPAIAGQVGFATGASLRQHLHAAIGEVGEDVRLDRTPDQVDRDLG